jgi:hypothetical protein
MRAETDPRSDANTVRRHYVPLTHVVSVSAYARILQAASANDDRKVETADAMLLKALREHGYGRRRLSAGC